MTAGMVPQGIKLGALRPLTKVILYPVLPKLLYYDGYQWMIEDELKAYRGHGTIHPSLNVATPSISCQIR